MAGVERWHASPSRIAAASRDGDTGEIRVPLSLFHVDQLQGDVELVVRSIIRAADWASARRLPSLAIAPTGPSSPRSGASPRDRTTPCASARRRSEGLVRLARRQG
jgi:hypothetical protein